MSRTANHPLFPSDAAVQDALLLLLLERGGDCNALWAKDTYEPLADFFDLSEQARSVTRGAYLRDERDEPYWHTWVQFSRERLVWNRDLQRPDPHWRGCWKLTERGKLRAESLAAGRSGVAFASDTPITPVSGFVTLEDLGYTFGSAHPCA